MLVLLFYKHFAKYVPGMSHIGLGNNAIFTAKVLKAHGIKALPIGVSTTTHIAEAVAQHPDTTHAVIEGTWFDAAAIETLVNRYHAVEWTCREHSQIAFLPVQSKAVAQVRGYGHVQDRTLNFKVSGNNTRFCRWYQGAYSQPCLLLPNLYPLDVNPPVTRRRRAEARDTLRISSYGAGRVLKNHPTSAAAALLIGRRLGRDIEFHINVGREPNLDTTARAVRSILTGVPGVSLVEDPWSAWSEFRHLIGSMDLNLQPSFTETFNLTTADGIIGGVPSVVSDAVEWAPRHWIADVDDPEDVARVGINLLLDPDAAREGLTALQAYQDMALPMWKGWLGLSR